MNYRPLVAHRSLTTSALALALCFSVSAQAKPTAEYTTRRMAPVVQPDDATARYLDEIEHLTRELTTNKAHRTALVTRMDDVRQTLQKLQSEETRENDKVPPITLGIATLDQNIADLEHQLEEKNLELENRQKTAENQPVPTLLEDALRSAAGLQKHRALAMQKYLIHKANIDIEHSRQKQQQLRAKKVALTQSGQLLQSNLGEYQTKLQDLIDNRRSLELQFTHLSAAIVEKQDRLEHLKNRLQAVKSKPQKSLFSNHRGDLPDPTAGVLQHRYAEPKAQGLLQWEGVLIAAPLGQQIKAVFDGTVVFADHMQGFGDVAIIDHGEGYMSLYGMADFLVVEQGQQVLGGDTIGTVGGSFGNDESTLYFEIRHNANTLNPEDWLGLELISQDNEP